MKVTVEITADNRDHVVSLVREVANKLKRSAEESGQTVNYCIGAYRVTVEGNQSEKQL